MNKAPRTANATGPMKDWKSQMEVTLNHSTEQVPSAANLCTTGYDLHLLHPRTKRPIGKDWTVRDPLGISEIENGLAAGKNLGMRTGRWSKTPTGQFVHVIDFDIRDESTLEDARTELLRLFPDYEKYPAVRSGSGGSSRHFHIYLPEPQSTRKLATSEGFSMVWDDFKQREVRKNDWEIELLGDFKNVVMPGSIHPDTGQQYAWVKAPVLWMIECGLTPPTPRWLLESQINETLQKDYGPVDLRRVKSALDAITDADEFGQWLRFGLALHRETSGSDEGYALWEKWSRQSEKFEEEEQRRTWLATKDEYRKAPVTVASIFHTAIHEYGWDPSPGITVEPDDFDDLDSGSENTVSEFLGKFDLTEDGVARAFEAKHEGQLRYCHSSGRWFAWTGTYWRPEKSKLAFEWMRRMCRKVAEQSPEAKAAAKALSKATAVSGAERLAQASRTFAVTSEQWDQDIWLIGTPGGTVDLKTGELKKSVQADGITKLTGAGPVPLDTFDPDRDCPRWSAFLEDATGGDEEVIRFLAQWAGYNLTGDTSEEALLFVHGPGGSGKSTWVNTIAGILGDYAKAIDSDTLTKRRHEAHKEEIARLAGVRMAYSSETEAGKSWAENRIKQLTGGDTMTGRFMRENTFEFVPHLKITIVGNNRPAFENLDSAIMRRFNVLAFDRVPSQPDQSLKAALQQESSGILSWAIKGCLDWQRNGLLRPASMVRETEAYFASEDTFGTWLEECCELDPNAWGGSTELRFSLNCHLRANGRREMSAQNFADQMERRGFSKANRKNGKGWAGIQIYDEFPERDCNA